MAWQWQSSTQGTLRGQLNGSDSTISVKGISGNAVTTAPQNTVDQINIILDIGGKTMIVNDKLEYNNTEGAIENV